MRSVDVDAKGVYLYVVAALGTLPSSNPSTSFHLERDVERFIVGGQEELSGYIDGRWNGR